MEKFLVLGLGKSGLTALHWLSQQGITAYWLMILKIHLYYLNWIQIYNENAGKTGPLILMP